MNLLVCLGILALPWLPQAAAALTGAEAMARAREQFAASSTFAARFEKQLYWAALDKTQKLQGRIYTRKPDRFRVEVEGGDLVVADGQAIWVYSKKNQQVVVGEYNGEVRTPWQVLLDYTAQWTPAGVEETRLEGRACYLLTLQPPGGGARQLKVWLEGRRWLLLRVEERDESGNLTTYTLREHQLGGALKPSLFRFVAPEGVEVIDRRNDGRQ
jgi:chaperone LolA